MIGEGPAARSVQIDLPPFTLVGATTRVCMLTGPMRDRFQIAERLDYYENEELEEIVRRSSSILDIKVKEDAVSAIGCRSRGTPRLVNRYLRRLRDFAQVHGNGIIDEKIVQFGFKEMIIDDIGLTVLDRNYMKVIIENHKGGPVGIETIAAGLSEDRGTLEDSIEPYLMRVGFLNRTSRGRCATEKAFKYFGIVPDSETQGRLF